MKDSVDTPQNYSTTEIGVGVFPHQLPSVFGRGCSLKALIPGCLQLATWTGKAGFGSQRKLSIKEMQEVAVVKQANVL